MACSMIRLEGVTKRFGDVVAVDDAPRSASIAARSSRCSARPAAGRRRSCASSPASSGPTRGRSRSAGARSPRGARGSRRSSAGRHGLPGLRALPPSHRRRERRLRAASPTSAPHACRSCSRSSGSTTSAAGTRTSSRAASSSVSPLARALAPSPELVLLDEPWSNVDPFLRESLRAEVTEIIRPLGVTVVLVTHDREEAFSLADRIALMRDGTVVQEGTPEELYFAPASRWAAEFVGAGERAPGSRRRRASSRRRSAPSRRTAHRRSEAARGPRPPGAARARARSRRRGGGRRPRVPRPRRLLPRAPGRRRARVPAAVDRGRPARLARLHPCCTRPRARARLSDSRCGLCKVPLHRG